MCSSERTTVTPPTILGSHIYRGKGMLQGLPVMKRWEIVQCPGRGGVRSRSSGFSRAPDPAEPGTHPWESLLFVQGTLGLQG